jgi:ABC-type nitrate/sulfonate/bicarbonate transport system, permease component
LKKFLNITNIIFILTIVLLFIPSKRSNDNIPYVLAVIIAAEVIFIIKTIKAGKKVRDNVKAIAAGDITAVVFLLIFAWELFTAKLNLLDKRLYPTPGEVLTLFVTEMPELLKGLVSSLQLLVSGFVLALVLAVPLALVIGWKRRLYHAVKPITKVLGPIPPIVYIPYTIAILPTFKMSSIFIIFIGAFWPIFINTLNGVFNIDRNIIDSAKTLNVKERTMLFEVILPGSIPAIISGSTIALVLSFILLTAAEMIGATSGLGWYVKFFSDFADYTRVIVGIIFIGIVVTGITFFMDKLEKYLLRWRK